MYACSNESQIRKAGKASSSTVPRVILDYIDIMDSEMLIKLKRTGATQIIIGLDQSFLYALAQCTEWRQYTVSYDLEFLTQISTQSVTKTKVSALGMLKRILAYRKTKHIYFLFKDNVKEGNITYEMLTNLLKFTLPINMDGFAEVNHGANYSYTISEIAQNLQQNVLNIHLLTVERLNNCDYATRLQKCLCYLRQIKYQNDELKNSFIGTQITINNESKIIYDLNNEMNNFLIPLDVSSSMTIADHLHAAWKSNAILYML